MSYLTLNTTYLDTPKDSIGSYSPIDHELIQFYKQPNLASEIIPKKKVKNKKYDIVYKVEGIDDLIHKNIIIYGWEKVKNKKDKMTWIKLSQTKSIWAPYRFYIFSESENEILSDGYDICELDDDY